ncbi:hypothetical protein [Pelagibacterium montanilacus]|uniref:hypothetical protein n=1 Tax=Pelagibacterium montanilacus TaxID=2185280 RepID=UPI000F8E6C06|nr:hypothetical protein [Pelagibacterium montanilacus]
MTYLDPDHAHHISRARLINRALKILAVAAVAAFGWFALTLGTGEPSNPLTVSEPFQPAS